MSIKPAKSLHYNEDAVVPVIPLQPQGTNSTLFTSCCDVAICNDEPRCPYCNRKVIGYDAPSCHARGVVRWRNATAHWPRSKAKAGES